MYETSCGDDKSCLADAQAFEEARKANLESKDAEVAEAARAYGEPGEENGVTVSFVEGKKNGETAVEPRYDWDTGSMKALVTVVVGSGIRGPVLQALVAHEGVHIVDGVNYIRSIDVETAKGDPDLARTHEQTETRAYQVTHRVLKELGVTAGYGSKQWPLGKGVSDKDAAKSIQEILKGDAYKGKLKEKQVPGFK
jgi:hypothetical protein